MATSQTFEVGRTHPWSILENLHCSVPSVLILAWHQSTWELERCASWDDVSLWIPTPCSHLSRPGSLMHDPCLPLLRLLIVQAFFYSSTDPSASFCIFFNSVVGIIIITAHCHLFYRHCLFHCGCHHCHALSRPFHESLFILTWGCNKAAIFLQVLFRHSSSSLRLPPLRLLQPIQAFFYYSADLSASQVFP